MGRPLFSAAYTKPVTVRVQEQQPSPAPDHPTYYRWSDRPFNPDADEFFESDDVVYEAFLSPEDLTPPPPLDNLPSPISDEEASTDESESEPSTRAPSPSFLQRRAVSSSSSSAEPTSHTPLQITTTRTVPRSTSHPTSLPTVSRLPPHTISRSSSSSSVSSPTTTITTTHHHHHHHHHHHTTRGHTFGTLTPPPARHFWGPFTNPGAQRSMSHIAPSPRIVRALADPVP